MKQRELWLDIAKAFSIILVVAGHSVDLPGNQFFSWFRMPLFFIVTGILFKSISTENYSSWALKRTKLFTVPYFSYGILVAIIVLFINRDGLIVFIKNIIKLVYGGEVLTNPWNVFWFITCLLLTHLIFGYITRFKVKIQVTLIIGAYIIAHIISMTSLTNLAIPWGIDSALMALTFVAIGFYSKNLIRYVVKRISTILYLIPFAAGFVLLDINNILNFKFDMKYQIFTLPILDVVIPVVFTILILSCCYWISKIEYSKYLAKLGTNTLTIMYMHVPLNFIVQSLLNVQYGFLIYTLIGIFGSLCVQTVFKRFSLLSALFLGNPMRSKIKE